MSEKMRQKKDHADPNKKRQRMRADVADRKSRAVPKAPGTDRMDKLMYKRGSAGDRTHRDRTASS